MEAQEMSVIDHLHELRKRIIISLVFIIIAAIIIYNKVSYLINILMKPIDTFNLNLVYLSLTEGFITRMQVALYTSIIIVSPIIFYEIAAFINPGLTKKEKKLLYKSAFFISFLFVLGVMLCYFLVLPHTLNFLIFYGKTYMTPLLVGSTYFNFIGLFCLFTGITFTMPFIIVLLGEISVINSKTLRKKRKFVIIITLLIEEMIMPSADLMTFLSVAAPIIILYEVSIWIIFFIEKHKKKVLST